MKSIPNKSIDLVLTDPPYGTTACKWDTIIPFEPMWKELKRIRKDNGTIALFGTEPFSSSLRISNINEYNHDLIWNKKAFSNNLAAKKQHLKIHEIISLFYKKQPNYYPQGLIKLGKSSHQSFKPKKTAHIKFNKYYIQEWTNYPHSIIEFKRQKNPFHPTQKPIALLEYLIKTYTLEGETILDFTMGSGSTGVACKNLNRKFIGIEKEETYFKIAQERINKLDLFNQTL